jgi:hypothetical protein
VGMEMETYVDRSAKTTDPKTEHDWTADVEGRETTRRYEPVIGTLVVITDDHEPVVEFDALDGEPRRRTALATVRFDRSAVGHPVELMFVRGDLDRPVITKLVPSPAWQAELHARWDALGRKALGVEPWPDKFDKLFQEAKRLACVAAWFEAQGNITRAASTLRTSRRLVRGQLNAWKSQNPRLVPRPAAMERMPTPSSSSTNAHEPEAEGRAPVPDGDGERSEGSLPIDEGEG